MRERTELILKLVCAVLVALLLAQIVKAGLRAGSLRDVKIPDLPTLASDTNAVPANGTNVVASAGKGTNKISVGTNAVMGKGTNAAAKVVKQGNINDAGPLTPALSASAGARENSGAVAGKDDMGSNSMAAARAGNTETNSSAVATNQIATNLLAQVEVTSNTAPVAVAVSNAPTATNVASQPQALAMDATNVSASTPTNARSVIASLGTNSSVAVTHTGTNLVSKVKGTNSPPPRPMAMNAGPPGMRGGGPAPELAPEIKARVNRIYESELLGPVMHPQPMALMGIAGNSAFLRSPSGQTGLVKEGDSLGEIKLLRIGINRVLVEQDGQKKELTIFEGYGGKSLLEDSK